MLKSSLMRAASRLKSALSDPPHRLKSVLLGAPPKLNSALLGSRLKNSVYWAPLQVKKCFIRSPTGSRDVRVLYVMPSKVKDILGCFIGVPSQGKKIVCFIGSPSQV